MRILLAIDGSAYSDAALKAVAQRPWPTGSVIEVLSVVEPPSFPPYENPSLPDDFYPNLEQAALDQAQAIVEKAVQQIGSSEGASLDVTQKIIKGHAKDVILKEAEEWKADLIVVGSHGYRGWRRFLLGSVSHAIVSHAHCSVEVVRAHTTIGKETE